VIGIAHDRAMPAPLHVTFLGGATGDWHVRSTTTVVGTALPDVAALQVVEGWQQPQDADGWTLRGVVSNDRYLRASEKVALVAQQPPLGRPEATEARLIPIGKTEAWWALTQEERRAILEESSKHIAIGLDYLPAVARRLHHCRDLGEPFDFVTWFEFAPADAAAFDELTARLRDSEEWQYVDREVEVALERRT
jgi:hypothetical protein